MDVEVLHVGYLHTIRIDRFPAVGQIHLVMYVLQLQSATQHGKIFGDFIVLWAGTLGLEVINDVFQIDLVGLCTHVVVHIAQVHMVKI